MSMSHPQHTDRSVTDRNKIICTNALASIINSLLGNSNCVKCIIEDDQHIFTSCAAIVLQNLDLEPGVSDLLLDAVQTHHRVQGSCCKTLVVMTGLWLTDLHSLLLQGIPRNEVLSVLQDAVDDFIKHGLAKSVIDISPSLDTDNDKHPGNSLAFGGFLSSSSMDNSSSSAGFSDRVTPSAVKRIDDKSKKPSANLNDDVSWFFDDSQLREYDPNGTSKCSLDSQSASENWLETHTRKPDLLSSYENSSRSLKNYQHHLVSNENNLSGKNVPQLNNCQPNCPVSYKASISQDSQCTGGKLQQMSSCITSTHSSVDDSDDEFAECFDGLKCQDNTKEDDNGARKLINIDSHELKMPANCSVMCDSIGFTNGNNCKKVGSSQSETVKKVKLSPEGNPSLQADNPMNSPNGQSKKSVLSEDANSDLREIRQVDVLLKKILNAEKTKRPSLMMTGSRYFRTMQSSSEQQSIPASTFDTDTARKTECKDENFKDSELLPFDAKICKKISSKVSHIGSTNTNHDATQEGDTQPDCMEQSETSRLNSPLNLISKGTRSSEQLSIDALASGLGHGHTDLMAWVLQAYRAITHSGSDTDVNFDLSLLHTSCVVGGDQTISCLYSGLVLPLSVNSSTLLSQQKTPYRALIINGDLRPGYKHTGYKMRQRVKYVSHRVAEQGRDSVWCDKVFSKLTDLNVSVLLVRGSVDTRITDFCEGNKILLVCDIKYKLLQAVAMDMDVSMVTYIDECGPENVVGGLHLSPVHQGDTIKHKSPLLACIHLNNTRLQTLVLCHPVEAVLWNQEELFWHCASRLRNVICSRKVLAGRGQTERNIAAYLENKADMLLGDACSENCFRPEILQTVASAFHKYASIVEKATSSSEQLTQDESQINLATSCEEKYSYKLSSEEMYVFDDYKAKIAAWHCAAHIVTQILLVDNEIISGLENSHRNSLF